MQTLSIMNLKVDMGYIPTFQVSPFANQPSSFIVDLLLIIGSWSKSLSLTYGNKTLALKNSNATYLNFFPLYFHFFILLVLLLKFEEYTSI
jgi:hypothetical protein